MNAYLLGHTSIYQEIIRCSTFTSEQEPVQPLKCTYKHDLRSATIAHNYRYICPARAFPKEDLFSSLRVTSKPSLWYFVENYYSCHLFV